MRIPAPEWAKKWILGALRRRNELRYLRRLATDNGVSLIVDDAYVAVRRGEKEIRISSENHVYAQDLIKNFDYYFDVVEPRSISGLCVADYSKPSLQTMVDDALPFWFPELAESMATTSIYVDRAGLKAGQTVFDLGAYAGGATYHFSRAVGAEGRVFAFEPDPRSFDCLIKNIDLHHLDNVVADRRGVWQFSGKVLFQAEGNMGSAIVETADRSSDTTEWIEVVSLDDFCAANDIQRVDFVKMDVEGSEEVILETGGAFIDRYRPTFIIEVHQVHGVRTDAKVISILEGRGYDVEILEQAGLPLPLVFARPR